MSSPYPLVGKHWALIEGNTIAVTGKIVQGSGGSGYLVRFETEVPYSRVFPFDAPILQQINLFEDETELGNFVEFFHKTIAPLNDEGPVDPELTDPNDVEAGDTEDPAVA